MHQMDQNKTVVQRGLKKALEVQSPDDCHSLTSTDTSLQEYNKAKNNSTQSRVLLLGQKCFEHYFKNISALVTILEGSASEFLQKQKPPRSRESFSSSPPCMIHELAAANGLLVSHGLFTEPLVNPSMNAGVAKLVYKQLHRHMNPFTTSWAFLNLDVANACVMSACRTIKAKKKVS